jgi:cell wall-associated NlpC family hydrolase
MRYFAARDGQAGIGRMSGQANARCTRLAAAATAALFAAAVHASDLDAVRADVVVQALALLGTPYRYGGNSPASGLDCSGLVRHVFATVVKRDLPRRSEDISAVGQPIARSELQPGDLVFFNTLRRAFSHVAIYIGDGRFVHAPAGRGRVRVEGLEDRYWAMRFDGARRVLDPAAAPAAGAALATTSEPAARPGPVTDLWGARPPEP